MPCAENGPRVKSYGHYARPHVALAEKALGRRLRGTELVHYVDENRLNNTPENLVVCPDMAYHALLHMRADALEACGNMDFRRCFVCAKYSHPSTMTSMTTKRTNGKYKCVTCKSVGGRSYTNAMRKARREFDPTKILAELETELLKGQAEPSR